MRLKVYAESLCESFRVMLSEQEVTLSEWEFIKNNLTEFIQCDKETYLKAVTAIANEFDLKIKISEKDSDFCDDYETKDDDFDLTNARIAWEDPTSSWQVALWAENLFDTDYVVSYNAISSDLGSPYVRRNFPRMYGMEVIFNW